MGRGLFDDALYERIQNPKKYLSTRVQYFCQFYALHTNGTQAAIEAGYRESNARDSARKLLNNEYVLAYINELSASLFDKIGMSRKWLAERYKELIDVNITDIYDENGGLKPLSEIPDHTKRAIARIKTEEIYTVIKGYRKAIGRTVDVIFYDKLKAIDSVCRMAGYNEEKSGVNINNSNVQLNFNNITVVEVTLNL